MRPVDQAQRRAADASRRAQRLCIRAGTTGTRLAHIWRVSCFAHREQATPGGSTAPPRVVSTSTTPEHGARRIDGGARQRGEPDMPLQLEPVPARSASRALPAPEETSAASAPPAIARGAVGRLSQAELTQQNVCAALLAAKDVDARRVEVEMAGQALVLRGVVSTPAEHARALAIARRVAGAQPVRDALAIRAAVEPPPPS